MLKSWLMVLLALVFSPSLCADKSFPDVRVVPWNGHKAATSLTFDDGDPSHLDVAIPELNQRGMKATFFLIANRIDRKDDWRKILAFGHEIGNHTLDHKHAQELSAQDAESQVIGAQNVLQKEFGISVATFAYPYIEITPLLKTTVGRSHLLARGGGGTEDMKPDAEPDWMNLPACMTRTDLPFSTYKQWIDKDFQDGAWMVWMIHGLEGTLSGWNPISKKAFEQILDKIQSKDIWVDTLLNIGSYFRAQKEFEKALVSETEGEKKLKWKVPDLFPPGKILKITLGPQTGAGSHDELIQGGRQLIMGKDGFYDLDFSSGELVIRLLQ